MAWPDRDILKCLRLGVALHHGALPTAYRKEVERLLRDGVLKVTISSPTLAQGLNLSATAVVIHSLYRHGEKIKVSEFKNVIGRAGRAYVDVEGLVLYPIFEDAKNKKHDEWVGLIEDLGAREMEDGLIQLIFYLLSQCTPASAATSTSWSTMSSTMPQRGPSPRSPAKRPKSVSGH